MHMMTELNLALWIVTAFIITFAIAIFLYFSFIPFLKRKWMYKVMSRSARKMSKNYTGEAKEDLEKLADMLKEAGKNDKIFPTEDEYNQF